MASPKAKLLYFVTPIYARGEHVIGENAKNDDGTPNMIRIERGTERKIDGEVAKDLVIAKQAIDLGTARPQEVAEAKAFVKERIAEEAREAAKNLKKAA